MSALSMDPGAIAEVARSLRSVARQSALSGAVSGGSSFAEVAAAVRAADLALERAVSELDVVGDALDVTAGSAVRSDVWAGDANVPR